MKSESRNPSDQKNDNLTGTQKALFEKAKAVVEENMSDPDFNNSVFIREMAVCKTVLYEKLKALTGQTISEFIESVRLKQAMYLLSYPTLSVSDIAYDTGFKSPALFSRSFKKHFGITPSEFSRRKQQSKATQPGQSFKNSGGCPYSSLYSDKFP